MPGADPPRELRALAARIAREEAPALLAEARAQAVAEARELIRRSILEALLDETGGESPVRAAAPAPDTSAPPAPRLSDATGTTAWYVYGVVPADPALELGGLQGVDPDQDVVTVPVDGLCALASEVPLAEFDEDALRRRLTEIDWVERIARAHERVLDALLDSTTVVPMRMCTVVRSIDRVRDMLRRERPLLEQAVADLRGRQEWGIKAFLRPEAADVTATEPEAPSNMAGPDRGTQYMQRRRAERDRRELAERRAAEAAERIHAQLLAQAAQGRALPVQPPEATGHPGAMVLNGVYLIAGDALATFHREVDALAELHAADGLELVATGPWPAYNFLPGLIGATG